MENIKALIFDMDGVITETSEMHYEAWKKTADKLEIPFDKHFNEQLKGISRRASLMKILERGNKSCSEDEIQDLMHDKNEFYVSLIEGYTQNDLNPGIYELMETLKENGIKIAVASASKSAPMLVEKMNIMQFVDCIVDPASVPGKPAPDIFLKAAEILGLDPSLCIGVEDAEAGVEAIKSADMFAIGIGDSEILKKADIVFEKTSLLTYQAVMKIIK
ncbi:beta-phosphoglucomutase [Acidaminobacter sp. JC074]|uniref:beta-phosphoglucomutase n=1 Tax=Acidaminobacter sp. JC074 TaxID=2530199 RepID=UPI001F0E10DA|nr:beta-phosphoglucomutase [Acidaminobacter sp. JC074]MCH4889064.1 beta-phosphoglucomutase [Acidaminobacter sp. JC074]